MSTTTTQLMGESHSIHASNSHIHVDAQTSGIEEIITRIAAEATALGAVIDPNLIVAEYRGHITVGSAQGREGQPFIHLPMEALIPVNGLVWENSADVQLLDGRHTLTPAQRTLLDLHVELWNASGKLDEYRARHPKVAATRDELLTRQIQRLRPTFAPDASTAGMVRTRTIALRGGGASGRQSVIMPILELADHHPRGAPYWIDSGALTSHYRFVDDSGITFVCYGQARDALDLACLYGYATDDPLFMVSAPLTINLGVAGTLTIRREGDRRLAPQWTADEAGISTNYLPVHVRDGLFGSLIQPVREYVESRGVDRPESMRIAMSAAEIVLDENESIVADILAVAQLSGEPGARVVYEASIHQLQVISAIREGA